jgi:hypothetical protein
MSSGATSIITYKPDIFSALGMGRGQKRFTTSSAVWLMPA